MENIKRYDINPPDVKLFSVLLENENGRYILYKDFDEYRRATCLVLDAAKDLLLALVEEGAFKKNPKLENKIRSLVK